MFEIFQEKGVYYFFEFKVVQVQQLVQQLEYLSIWFLFDQFYLNYLFYFFINDIKKKEIEIGQERLILLIRLFDDFYEVVYIFYQLEFKNCENVLDDLFFVDNYVDFIEYD